MKILQIARQFPPVVGGLPGAAYGLTRALTQKGYRADVVTLDTDFVTGESLERESVIDGIRVTRIPYFGSTRYPIAPEIFSRLADYDILHIHAIDFFVDWLTLSRWWHRKPIVVTTHGGIFHTQWLYRIKQLYFNTITRRSLHGADEVICVSQHDYDIFRAIVPESKLHVLMGLDLDPFLSIKKQIQPGLLLGIGRVSENKRVDRLISLLPKLAEEFPEVKLVWVGNDPEQLMPKLTAQAQELGVASRVQFLGQISDAELYQLVSKANLFVSASSHEGFGISTIEAMSSGTVPVVTAVGVHPDVVKVGKTGFVYDFEPELALSHFRQALALDATQLETLGHAAREMAQQFSWHRVVNAHIDVYQKLLAAPGRVSLSTQYQNSVLK